jgi:hemerythrin-like metal-binding protein
MEAREMAFIEWRGEMSVSVAAFDEQHKGLIALINKLHEAMKAGQGRGTMDGILTELLRYTDVHFAAEEKAFEKHGYPAAPEHRAIHRAFVEKVEGLIQKHKAGSFTVTVDTLAFLNEWLVSHIMGEDHKYAAFFAGKAV